MRVGIFIVVASLVVAACGTGDSTGAGSDDSPTPEMMAVALTEVVAKDHTFGNGPPPFTEYLVQNRIDPLAGDATAPENGSDRALTEAERNAIEDAIADYGTVRWIDDPADWRTPDLVPTVEGAAILGVGEPIVEEDTGLVPVSLWCGGLCGTWLTYRLDLVDGSWSVTDIEGPIAVS